MSSPDYPCCICSEPCMVDAIECSLCTGWVHFKCVPLSDELLKAWDESDYEFACKNCIFRTNPDGQQVFDFTKALQSIKSCIGNIERQQAKAKEVQLLLETYKVSLPPPSTTFSGQQDIVSSNILRSFQPMTLRKYTPIKTVGDGNCLYRAVSRMLYGSEKSHKELRLRSTLEILENQSHYDSSSADFVDQIQDIVVVTSDYAGLINSACSDGAYSELLHMYALSAATRTILYSFYPPTDPCGIYSKSFSRKVIGRLAKPFAYGSPVIMWTQTVMPLRGRDFIPNHFVPLLYNKLKTSGTTNCEEDECDDRIINEDDDTIEIDDDDDDDDDDDNNKKDDDDDDSPQNSDDDLPQNNDVDSPQNNDDDDDNDDDSPQCDIKGPCMGTLASGFLSTADATRILTESEDCKDSIPIGYKNNMYVVVNNSENVIRRQNNQQSQFWDDCGAWTGIKGSSPKQYFLLQNSKFLSVVFRNGEFYKEKQINKKRVFIKYDPQPSMDNILILQRVYNTHKSSSAYKRRITWLKHLPSIISAKLQDIALVEYQGEFPGRQRHGNSKNCQLYKRTLPCVLQSIGNLSDKMNPRNVYDKLHHQTLDEMKLPRNLQQIKNKKKNDAKKQKQKEASSLDNGNFADNFVALSALAQSDPFIQKVVNTKNKVPSIVCYSEEQVKDIRRFCAKPEGTVWGFDKTFNLGDVYVTPSVFKNMAVKSRDSHAHPIFPGPVFFHGNSDYETYNDFFGKLSTFFTDEEHTNLVFGTDDESSVRKAIKRNFPTAANVLCTRHLKNNVKDYLVKNVPADITTRKQIIQTIFGENGITSAEDEDVLCYRSQSAVREWTQQVPDFVQYFQERLLPLLTQNVCIPQQMKKIDANWTNNNCESLNHVLKVKTSWKQLKLKELVLKVYEFVDAKYKDLKRALYNEGSFYLTPDYSHHLVDTDVWYSKSSENRSKLFLKFLNDVGKKKTNRVSSKDGKLTLPVKSTKSKKLNQIRRSKAERTTSVKRKRDKLS